MAVTTATAARCVGESARRSYYGGTQKLGRCARPVAFAVMGWGRHGGHSAPDLTCQAHLGGLVARLAGAQRPYRQRLAVPSVTVTAVTPAGLCVDCQQRPEDHEPGAACPRPL